MAKTREQAQAAREAKLDELHESLTGAVEELVSGPDWARALTFAARFRSRSFNNTLLIAAKDVDIAFVRPESGMVLVRTSMHIAKNTKEPDAALGYIDAALSAEVQQQLQAAPYYLVPTNAKAKYSAEIEAVVGGGPDMLLKNPIPDWPTINKSRTDWLKEFTAMVRS